MEYPHFRSTWAYLLWRVKSTSRCQKCASLSFHAIVVCVWMMEATCRRVITSGKVWVFVTHDSSGKVRTTPWMASLPRYRVLGDEALALSACHVNTVDGRESVSTSTVAILDTMDSGICIGKVALEAAMSLANMVDKAFTASQDLGESISKSKSQHVAGFSTHKAACGLTSNKSALVTNRSFFQPSSPSSGNHTYCTGAFFACDYGLVTERSKGWRNK